MAVGPLNLTVLAHHGKHHKHGVGQGQANSPKPAHGQARPERPAQNGQPEPSRVDVSRINNLHDARRIIADLDRQNQALRGQGQKAEVLGNKLRESDRRRLFEVEAARYPNRVHIYLNDDSYYNVEQVAAAKMIGHFTQKLKMEGFPWELRKEVAVGPLKVPRPVSEMEALQMLQNGEEVLFQPKRIIDLNLSPDAVGSLALLSTPAAPAAAAATLKQANVKIEGAGRQIPYGKPVPVHSFGELKLLFDMYNPEAQLTQGDELSDISKKIAFFAMKRHNTPYPFSFYKASPSSRWTNALKSGAAGAIAGCIIGGVTGLLLQGPIGTALGVKVGMLAGAKLGAIGFGLYRGAKELFVSKSKDEINVFEAMDRITKGETVILQEKKLHSLSMLIFGKLTYFTDYGRGSEIKSKNDLDIFHAMQNQWPEKKKEDDKDKDPAKKA